MMGRALGLLPLLVAAGALGNATRAWPLTLVLVLMLTLLAGVGPRFELDSGRQMLTSAIGAGVGYVSASLGYEPEPGQLGEGWTKLGTALLLAAAARALILTPRGGYVPTLGLAFGSLVAAGKTQSQAYVIFVVLLLLTGTWALAGPPARGAGPTGRRIWMGAAVLVVAALLGLGTTSGLRRLHAWAQNRARYSAYTWQPQVGFSDRMDLGALEGLLDSDKRVLRVRGARVDYLRGASLDLYEGGRWLRSEPAEVEVNESFTGDLREAGGVEITTLAERSRRFFIPLEARHIVTSPSAVSIDGMGAVKAQAKREIESVRFVPGARDRAALAPPRAADLQLPRRLRPRLEALARAWSAGAATPLEQLRALEARLVTEYSYARAFERPHGTDPVLDFLFSHKLGHCEYFATALALLARTLGIPTRLTMGYRVGEKSPFGYYVVRQRNAHAWVEAWLPGAGWSTRDATPDDGLLQNREHQAGYLASSLDALGVAYDEVTDWLGRLTLAETSLAWLTGSVVLAAIVARGARQRSRRARPPDDEAALPFMLPLLTRLAKAGHARRPDEALEDWAQRLPDPEPARLIRRYTALRYGSEGDPRELASDVAACAKSLRRRA